jgi:oxalate decarboxylase/phosphoglucose isomerase-like protein (cupin superfamily)
MSAQTMLAPGAGRRILGGGLDAVVKTTMGEGAFTATFEVVVPPGYDVGAHLHAHGQEIFHVLEGELDVLAFEPVDRAPADWHDWQAPNGSTYLRGGPGAMLWVPENTPHAFANRSGSPVRMFFQSSAPGGHDHYFDELAELLRAEAPPDPDVVAELRRRYDIEQITALHDGR